MQSKFTLESFVWKVNDSGTRQIKEPVLSGSEEPVPTPSLITFYVTVIPYASHVNTEVIK